MASDDSDPNRPKRIATLANEIADDFADQQRQLSRAAQDAGYGESVFRGVAASFESVPDDPLLISTEQSLRKFQAFSDARSQRVKQLATDITTIVYSTGNTATSTAAAVLAFPSDRLLQPGVLMWPVKVAIPPQPPNWTPDRFEAYAARLDALDRELGAVYRSVWQKFHAGTDDPYRAALAAMRQSYDHLFRILAPDEKVRLSEFFSEKTGEKPNQVHRQERLRFAARNVVKEALTRELLEAEVENVLQLYQRLNKLHDTRELDRLHVQQILLAMQSVMEQWIDALELKGNY